MGYDHEMTTAWLPAICLLTLTLTGCANTQYAGLNYVSVTGPNGETWTIASGKDQTNTKFDIKRGDVAVHYESAKEDATAALSTALQAQAALLNNIINKLFGLATMAATPQLTTPPPAVGS